MPKIKKVLNTSVILVSDEQLNEYIILQKGIGYGRKAGEEVEILEESQMFIPCCEADRKNLLDLLVSIPSCYLEIAQEVIAYAEKQLNTKLNDHIYLTLTDHIHFAVERHYQKMIVVNHVFWEMKTFYREQFKIGQYALKIIEKKLGICLPEEEAANIAFHIINAQKEQGSGYDAMRAAKLIGQVVTVVTYSLNCQPDKESIHYSRFISHMQYFSERFFSGKLLESDDDFLYEQMKKGYPKAMACAEKIRTHILKEYDNRISNEEVAYLAVHIQRLLSRK